VAVSDRFMDTLKTQRRVILRVFHERDINWECTGPGDVVVYEDGSINSRKLLPKGAERNGRDDDKDKCCLGAYLVHI
jgi:hypothetical protein